MKSNCPSIGVLIRFSNSATTLPAVLEALERQTLRPEVILGIASNCTDDSRSIMASHLTTVIEWTDTYEHSRVLNFGMNQLETDLVLILSSHTVLESPDALQMMVARFNDPTVACVSIKWDDDPYYSDSIDWEELQRKGLRFGAIYSNSMGMIRREFWKTLPFDEAVPTAEDYVWAVEQLFRGYRCARIALPFHYQRTGINRDNIFARMVFRLAKRHRLKVTWLGALASLKILLTSNPRKLDPAVWARFSAWFGSSNSVMTALLMGSRSTGAT